MPTLKDLIGPIGVDEFFRSRHGKAHLISSDIPGLPGWDAFNVALSKITIEDRKRLVFSSNRKTDDSPDDVWRSNGDVSPAAVRRRIRAGETLIINHFNLDTDAFKPLEHDFRRWFHENLNVNCYVSMRPQIGFGPHWDDHDVFAVQLEGRKYWALYGFTGQDPLDKAHCPPLPPDPKPIWEGYLEKGQCLYLPRGLWHSAVSTGAPSMHVACGARGPTGVDVIAWLAAVARDESLLRAGIRPGNGGAGMRAELSAALCDFLRGHAATDLVERFLEDRSMQTPPEGIPGFPDSLEIEETDVLTSIITYTGPPAPRVFKDSERFETIIGGVKVTAPATCLPAFEHLCRNGQSPFEVLRQLADQASAEALRGLIADLEAADAAVALHLARV